MKATKLKKGDFFLYKNDIWRKRVVGRITSISKDRYSYELIADFGKTKDRYPFNFGFKSDMDIGSKKISSDEALAYAI